ncbi:MAG: methyltransferase domain-containing protein [Thermoleophilia bacterium]|nr:methyltransferase domain-containing protein [Thermoleophilia bacterium]
MDEKRTEELRGAVLKAYSAAAEHPDGTHPFPVGRKFALSIGYSEELLASLPGIAVDSFAGVTNLSVSAGIPPKSKVLDLGCGAGLDSLIAARRAGPDGWVAGVDFSGSMLDRARHAAKEAGLDNVDFYLADAESLPFPDGLFDVALVNGIFNLNPRRDKIIRELYRVMKPGGTAFIAEIILKQPLAPAPGEEGSNVNWFA